ncbi:serine/threonine protein kinase, CMGC, dual-specificity [Collariella sp. IMI 366227]|nr:serine/threonine protein kinase, CMGC, dual-specificity [Collariella sp. IMI 366227]
MLSASSSNNHSLFSFGGRNGVTDNNTTSFEFLPSVSFDDLQSSLESASTDFKLTQFPSPTGQGTILGDRVLAPNNNMVERPDMARNTAASHGAVQQPPMTRSRTGSILRKPNPSNKPTASTASAAPTNPGVPNAPTAPAAMRSRRQSHYPPVSNTTAAKPPRKSTGDMGLAGEFEPRKRRPSVGSLSDRNGLEPGTRSSVDGASRSGDFLRAHATSRSAKARSVQPPPRASQALLTPDTTSLSLDQSHISMAMPRSPRAAAKGSHPASAKRMSVMPGVPQLPHVTGLGARTISPTDTRRMKRLSMHHTQGQTPAPVLPNPPPFSADIRPSSRSPSMLPRKISTPSSSRTTPDPNRKSYSSGLSVTSNTSFGAGVRTSTASVPQRNSQLLNSRLPAPKALNLHNSANHDDDEDVPPVPAIPKAYESPKDFLAEAAFIHKRKSNLTFDASSIHSNSTGSMTGGLSEIQPAKLHRRPSHRKSVHTSKLDLGTKPVAAQSKKTLQPLRQGSVSAAIKTDPKDANDPHDSVKRHIVYADAA